ncbi:hypothetical protein D3C84_737640 [compost metagenome]
MYREDGYDQGDGQCYSGRSYQQANDQRQATEEFGTTRQQRHQQSRRQAQAFHELGSPGQAATAKQTKQFLCAMSHENDPDDDADDTQTPAGSAGKYGVESGVHEDFLGSV